MLIQPRLELKKCHHVEFNITYKTCDSCGTEHNMVEYFIRVKNGQSEAICPSCYKHHLFA